MENIIINLKKRSAIFQIIGTLIATGLLIYLLKQQGWDEIVFAVQNISIWQLILAMGIMMISRLSVIARWYTLLRSAGITINFKQTTRITFAGLFLTNFLPTTIGGDVIRLIGAVQLKLDAAICTASLIVDRLVGLSGMLLVVPLTIPSLLSNPLFTNYPQENFYKPDHLLSIAWLHKLRTKVLDILQRLLYAIQLWRRNPLALGKSLGWSFLHMLCLFTIISLLLEGIGEALPFWQIAGYYSLVYLVTLIPISINGYGVQEITMSFVLTHLGGVSLHASITLALLFRTLMMLASLPGAIFVPNLLSAGYYKTNQIAPNINKEQNN